MTDQSALVPVNPQQIATIPLEQAIAQTVDRWLESQNCEDSADTKSQNRLLTDLIEELPLGRGSIYQLIRELSINTIMAPAPNGKGRVAWLTSDDAERLRDVAHKVANKQIKIADASMVTGTTSKRQGWKAATFYLRPETLAQLRRVVMERKLEGATGDLSDAVEEALQAWLNDSESPTDVALHGIDKPSEIDMNEAKVRFTVDLPKTIHRKLAGIAIEKQCRMTDIARSVLFDWTRRNVV